MGLCVVLGLVLLWGNGDEKSGDGGDVALSCYKGMVRNERSKFFHNRWLLFFYSGFLLPLFSLFLYYWCIIRL